LVAAVVRRSARFLGPRFLGLKQEHQRLSEQFQRLDSRIAALERCLGLADIEVQSSGAERLERLLEMRLGQLDTRLMTHFEGHYPKGQEVIRA
jgi:hypothetical protein